MTLFFPLYLCWQIKKENRVFLIIIIILLPFTIFGRKLTIAFFKRSCRIRLVIMIAIENWWVSIVLLWYNNPKQTPHIRQRHTYVRNLVVINIFLENLVLQEIKNVEMTPFFIRLLNLVKFFSRFLSSTSHISFLNIQYMTYHFKISFGPIKTQLIINFLNDTCHLNLFYLIDLVQLRV